MRLLTLFITTVVLQRSIADLSLISSQITKLWLTDMNSQLEKFYQEAAINSWNEIIGKNLDSEYSETKETSSSEWRKRKCKEASELELFSRTQYRSIYLLCRGPMYSSGLVRELSGLEGKMAEIYKKNRLHLKGGREVQGETDLAKLMSSTRDPEMLRWIWFNWTDTIGPPALSLFPRIIELHNSAARTRGYRDIGECWREELEIPDLQNVVEDLFQEIAPFHRLLHGFVRFKLSLHYGESIVPKNSTIPAHLLGDMWAQNWEGILDLVADSTLDMDKALKDQNLTVTDIMKLGQDFFTSMGFPSMTEDFWKNSDVEAGCNEKQSCHGAAVNMFNKGDFRISLCGSVNWKDLTVIHHEMGHIVYYMAYENQSTIFKAGANSAFQEAIGDTIMLAVETPVHLERMGITSDIHTKELKLKLLLHQALKKIPQLAFGLALERWRWEVMASSMDPSEYSALWWHLRRHYEGVSPPRPVLPYSLDPATKYHIAYNMPYIRYYLSGFLQFQFLDILCSLKKDGASQPLSECDLYGSKISGQHFRKMLSKGASVPWWKLLQELSLGKEVSISAKPLLAYFSPLIKWLETQQKLFSIPIGW